jgi:tetratricopeptide (TPR) repeat protein
MALGPERLDDAIAYYETGMQYGPYESLAYYGAAVAYDRDGQWGKAVELMRDALERDPNGRPDLDDRRGVHRMGRLTDRGVYFVPEGELEYYFALGYHVQGQRQEALRYYKRFLAQLPGSRFAARAREHIAELEAELGGAGGGPARVTR